MTQTEGEKKRDFLTTLRDISVIFAVYLYFVGWTYEFYFLGHFGVALTSVDIPVYYFFIYAFSALTYYLSFVAFGIGVVIFYIIILFFFSLPDPVRLRLREPGKYLFSITLILLFPILFYGAKAVGEIRAKEVRTGKYPSKSVRMLFKKELATRYPKDLLAANDAGQLKLLTHTKDTYFVFWQVQNETLGSQAVPYGYTYHVARNEVDLLTVEMRGFSKTEVTP